MAETALGVLGLSGLFSVTLEIWRLIDAGSDAPEATRAFQSKLDAQRQLFLIWGDQAGFGSNDGYDVRLDDESIRPTIHGLLLQIHRLLSNADQLSEKYGVIAAQSTSTALIAAAQSRALARSVEGGHKGTRLVGKVEWALKGKSQADALIADLTCFVDDLCKITDRLSITGNDRRGETEPNSWDGFAQSKYRSVSQPIKKTIEPRAFEQERRAGFGRATCGNPGDDESSDAQEVKQYLKSLRYPGMVSRVSTIDMPLQSTCEWIEANDVFETWVTRTTTYLSGPNFCLIKGKPGSGKSVLMKFISGIPTLISQGAVIRFFFSAKGLLLERSLHGLVRSVAYQLVKNFKTAARVLMELYPDKLEDIEEGIGWSTGELVFFIRSFWKRLPQRPIFMIIDGLDECDRDDSLAVAEFLHDMSQDAAATGSCVGICLSSRPFSNMPFEPFGASPPTLTLDQLNRRDIRSLVDRKFSTFGIHNDLEWADVKSRIVRDSRGVLLWASLVVSKSLRLISDGRNPQAVMLEIDRVPQELEALYTSLLQGPVDDVGDNTKILRLFWWAVLGLRTFTLREWELILAFVKPATECNSWKNWTESGDYPKTLDTLLQDIRRFSRGLVDVIISGESDICTPPDPAQSVAAAPGSLDSTMGDSITIGVIHDSVRSFFLDGGGFRCLDSSDTERNFIGEGHKFIFESCLAISEWPEWDALLAARLQPPNQLPGGPLRQSGGYGGSPSDPFGSGSVRSFSSASSGRAPSPLVVETPDFSQNFLGVQGSPGTISEEPHAFETEPAQLPASIADMGLETSDTKSLPVTMEHLRRIDVLAADDQNGLLGRWLELETCDSAMGPVSLSDSLVKSHKGQVSRVLELWNPFLFYATDMLLHHAKLAEDSTGDERAAVSLNSLLRLRDSWERVLTLREDSTADADFEGECRQLRLDAWLPFVDENAFLDSGSFKNSAKAESLWRQEISTRKRGVIAKFLQLGDPKRLLECTIDLGSLRGCNADDIAAYLANNFCQIWSLPSGSRSATALEIWRRAFQRLFELGLPADVVVAYLACEGYLDASVRLLLLDVALLRMISDASTPSTITRAKLKFSLHLHCRVPHSFHPEVASYFLKNGVAANGFCEAQDVAAQLSRLTELDLWKGTLRNVAPPSLVKRTALDTLAEFGNAGDSHWPTDALSKGFLDLMDSMTTTTKEYTKLLRRTLKTALHHRNWHAIQALLASGASLDTERDFCRAVSFASESFTPRAEGVVRQHFSNTTDVNMRLNAEGYPTVLHVAAGMWDFELMETLLSVGANAGILDTEGRSAMHHICSLQAFDRFNGVRVQSQGKEQVEKAMEKAFDCVELLIRAGCDGSAKDRDGKTAYDAFNINFQVEKSVFSIYLRSVLEHAVFK